MSANWGTCLSYSVSYKAPKVQMPRCSSMYASLQLADAYDSTYAAVDQWKHQTVPWKHAMCTEAVVEVTSRSTEHSGKQQIIATVLWKHRL